MNAREASTGDLLRGLVNDLNALVDREILLARQEVREDLQEAKRGGIVLAVGGMLLLGAYVGLVVLLIALLALFLALWAAALIVLAVFAIVGGALAYIGLQQVRIRPLKETRESLREDVEWAKQQLRPGER